LIAFVWFFDSRPRKWSYAGHVLIVIAWIIAYPIVVGKSDQPAGFAYDFWPSNLLRNYAAYLLDFSNYIVWPIDDRLSPRVRDLADMRLVQMLLAFSILAEIAVAFLRRATKSDCLRIVAFGFAWFLIATFPVAIFSGRLFMRYSYFGHAGLAVCGGALIREFARFAMRQESLSSDLLRATE
jgi:hypothetical protein